MLRAVVPHGMQIGDTFGTAIAAGRMCDRGGRGVLRCLLDQARKGDAVRGATATASGNRCAAHIVASGVECLQPGPRIARAVCSRVSYVKISLAPATARTADNSRLIARCGK